MEDLKSHLEAVQPGLRVVVADNLCETQVMRDLIREHQMRPSVIGGCADLKAALGFWEEPESCVIDPDTVGLVDLVKEVDSSYSPGDRWSRAKALLRSKVERQEKFDGIPAKARRVQIATPQGEVTRRDLLQSILPKYRVAPYVDSAKCAGQRCRICRQACPSDAISVTERKVSIDILRCKGCGACSAVCPRQAVVYPNYSLEQMEAEVAGLLAEADPGSRPIIAFACQSASQHLDALEETGLPPNIFLVEVPCLAMIPAWLMLRAFELGAQGVALVACKEKCRLGIEESVWRGNVDFAQGVLQRLGVEPKRLSLIEGGDITADLRRVADAVAAWPPIPGGSVEGPVEATGPSATAAVIRGLAAKVGGPLRGTVTSGKVPFGKVVLDGRRCTACGICVPECPTGALTAVTEGDSVRIIFKQSDCVGCRQCAEICPEKCLEVDRVLELGRLDGEPKVLLEGDFARCIWCGKPFAPRSMLEKLRGRIASAGGNTSQLDKCPECRMKGRPAGARRNGSGVQRDG